MVCPHQFGAKRVTADLCKVALQDWYVLSLFREEYFLIHSVFEKFLQKLKTKELVPNIFLSVIKNEAQHQLNYVHNPCKL